MGGIKLTYFHKMSVSRIKDSEDENGGTVQVFKPVLSLQLKKCAFSQPTRTLNTNNIKQSTTTNKIEFNSKIFCPPELEILAGDRIRVTYKTRDLGLYEAGKPYIYETHQEIPVNEVDEA